MINSLSSVSIIFHFPQLATSATNFSTPSLQDSTEGEQPLSSLGTSDVQISTLTQAGI